MLRFKQDTSNDSIWLIGELNSKSAAQIEKILTRYKEGFVKLDFSQLSELDEYGMRPLLLASKRLRNADGDLIIVNIPDKIAAYMHSEGYSLIVTTDISGEN